MFFHVTNYQWEKERIRGGEKSKKFSIPPACLLYFVVCVGSRQTHSQHQRSCEVQSRPEDSNSNIHEVIPLPRALRGETAFMRLHSHHENTQPTLKNHMLNEPAHTHTPTHSHGEGFGKLRALELVSGSVKVQVFEVSLMTFMICSHWSTTNTLIYCFKELKPE